MGLGWRDTNQREKSTNSTEDKKAEWRWVLRFRRRKEKYRKSPFREKSWMQLSVASKRGNELQNTCRLDFRTFIPPKEIRNFFG